MNRWGVIAGIAALTAGGAALRAIFLRYPYIDSDQAVIGLMGIRILRGEFPIYFWGEPYSGTLESFVAALTFFLFGVSRLTLNAVPFLFSLIFLLLTWRLGLVIFDRLTGLLGLALAAFPPMLLTWHSVLARGNYIENLVLGNLLLLLTLKLAHPDLRPAAHCRALLVYGSVLGFAWYMSFQSVHYLIVSVLFLLWRGRRSLLLRQSWIGLLAAMVGSLPFWVHNLTTGFSSFGAIRGYARGASPLDAFTLFVSVKLPVLLGASGFPHNFERLVTRQVPFLEWVIPGLYTASFLLALGMFVRGKVAPLSKGWRGVEILLLLPLVVAGVTVGGGFGAAGDARYLLPIYTSAPLLLGGLVAALARRSRPLGAVVLGVVLFSNLYGHLTTAEGLPRYGVHLDNDRALFAYMRKQGLRHAFVPEYWFSYRLTFDASESLIFATPFWRNYPRFLSKYPPYTRLAGRQASLPYVLWRNAADMEETLRTAGVHYEKIVIGRLTLLDRLRPPQPEGRSLMAVTWRVAERASRAAFDRDLTTGWRGRTSEPLTIDLGEVSTLLRISLHLGADSYRAPHGLQVLASKDGSTWSPVVTTGPLTPGFAWVGDRLLLEEHGRVALSLPRVAARYLRVNPAPGSRPGFWAANELFVYADGPAPPPPPFAWDRLYADDEDVQTQALLDSLRWIRATPDLEAAHVLFRLALLNLGLPLDWMAIDEHLASRLARAGRWAEALPFYQSLVEREPFRARRWHDLRAAYEGLGVPVDAKRAEAEARSRFTAAVPSGIRFGGTLKLVAHEIESTIVPQGGRFRLGLIWQALRAPKKRYAVVVHVTDSGRRVFSQDHYPLDGAFPTSQWEAGELVREGDEIRVPPDLPPGRYQIALGVWETRRRAELRVWRGWLPTWKKSVPLGEITVIPRQDGRT